MRLSIKTHLALIVILVGKTVFYPQCAFAESRCRYELPPLGREVILKQAVSQPVIANRAMGHIEGAPNMPTSFQSGKVEMARVSPRPENHEKIETSNSPAYQPKKGPVQFSSDLSTLEQKKLNGC